MIIAVVDDDPGVLKALGRLLSELGHSAELFASAEEFLSAVATSKAKCLIVDVQLGDMSGLELVRQLSATAFRLPVIVMSGSSDCAYKKQAMELGCVAYLCKPITLYPLVMAIEMAIELASSRAPIAS